MHPKYYKSGRPRLYFSQFEGDAGGGGPLDAHSAGDKIAALLGGDDGEPAGQADAAPTEAANVDAATSEADDADGNTEGQDDEPQDDAGAISVEVDGQTVTLTKEQIAEAYKAGQSQGDAQRAVQEAAEAKAKADTEAAQARQKRDEYMQKLATDTMAEQRLIESAAAQLTDELLESDPIAYIKLQNDLKARYAELQKAQGELQKLGAERQQEFEQAVQSYRADQYKRLIAKLPEWSDPEKAKAGAKEVQEFLLSQEFTPEEIAQVADHRILLLARKAMQLEQITAKAKAAAKKVATLPPKVERPGHKNVKPTDGRTVAMKRLGATGSIDDAAALLSSL